MRACLLLRGSPSLRLLASCRAWHAGPGRALASRAGGSAGSRACRRARAAPHVLHTTAAAPPAPALDAAAEAAGTEQQADSSSGSSPTAPAQAGGDTAVPPPPLSQLVPVPTAEHLSFGAASCTYVLRDYQVEAIQHVLSAWKAGTNMQLVMLPTGCGKTVVFAALARFMAQHAPVGGRQQLAAGDTRQAAAAEAGADAGADAGTGVDAGAAAEPLQQWAADGEAQQDALGDMRRFRSRRAGRVDGALPTAAADDSSSSDSSTGSTGSSSSRSATAAMQEAASSGVGGGSGRQRRGKAAAAAANTAPIGCMRVLVLAHREELLQQTEEKFRLVWNGVAVSWVKASRKEYYGQVVVASVQTAINCIPDLLACGFSLVVVDEAHHSVAATYKAVLQGLGFIEELDASSSSSDTSSNVSSDVSRGSISSSSNSDSLLVPVDVLDAASSSSSSSSSSLFSSSSSPASSSLAESSDGSSSDDSGRSSPGYVPRYAPLPNPHALLVGFTATPYRLTKQESRELYDLFTPVFTRNITDMIKARHLCQVTGQRVVTGTDLQGVATASGGDFVLSRLSPVVNSASRNRLVLQAYLQYCTEPDGSSGSSSSGSQAPSAQQLLPDRAGGGESAAALLASLPARGGLAAGINEGEGGGEDGAGGVALSMAGRRAVRKAIGFAVDIAHAEALTQLFTEAGVRAACVHSKMHRSDVRAALAAWRHDHYEVMFNCEKLTEGFDMPSITAVLMARPTKSTGLYTQMLGRGLRKLPGKEDCLVLDFTDRTHSAARVADLRVILEDIARTSDWERPESVDNTVKVKTDGVADGELDVLDEEEFDARELSWVCVGPHWVQSLFSLGCLWLVNLAGMGAQQRQQLGLLPSKQQQQQQRDEEAQQQQQRRRQSRRRQSAAGDEPGGSSTQQQQQDEDDEEDRFVVLYQAKSSQLDASRWDNAVPLARIGLSLADAYDAASDYLLRLVRNQQVAVARSRSWQGRRRGTQQTFHVSVETFKQAASWRSRIASPAQLEFLRRLQPDAELPAVMRRGEAADRITATLYTPATPQQLEQLQAQLGPAAVRELPVPLLRKHADTLLSAAGGTAAADEQLGGGTAAGAAAE